MTSVFQPCTGDGWHNPYDMYRLLRETDPVSHVLDNGEGEDYFVLSRHADIFAASVDGETFTSTNGLTHSYKDMELHEGRETPIVMMDGPEHMELRQVALPRFKPDKLAVLEPVLRRFVIAQLEHLKAAGSGDIISALCKPLPSLFVAGALGVPLSDRTLFDGWAWAIAGASASGNVMAASNALSEMVMYFSKMITDRRANPADDMISTLVHAKLADGGTLSDMKILGMGFTMVLGGNDTATGLLSSAAEYLTRYPEQRAKLMANPALMKNAIEEFLRLSSPVQGLARTVTKDVTLHDVTIPEGRKVMLLYASGNRDPRAYGDKAEICDITRPVKRHLAFSAGAHLCIGAAGARMQARIFLEELLRLCPDFSVDHKAGKFAQGHFVRRYDSLPFQAEGFAG